MSRLEAYALYRVSSGREEAKGLVGCARSNINNALKMRWRKRDDCFDFRKLSIFHENFHDVLRKVKILL